MTEKTVRYVNIFHPAFLGGKVYAISQPHLYETSEFAIRIANGACKNGSKLLHDCIRVEWTPEADEHDYSVPAGHIVRFMNVERPNHIQPDSYAAGQVGLYSTAEAAKAQADRIRLGCFMEDAYIAVAVPVIFKGLAMSDGWIEHDDVNYASVHREELRIVDMNSINS